MEYFTYFRELFYFHNISICLFFSVRVNVFGSTRVIFIFVLLYIILVLSMPSWDIHRKFNSLYDSSIVDVDVIDRIIDSVGLHDFGRRLPRIGFLDFLLNPDKYAFKVSRISSRFSFLCDFSDLFYLHHALDFISLYIASAMIVGRDPLDFRDNILSGLIKDLKYVYWKVWRFASRYNIDRYPFLSKRLIDWIKSNISIIIGDLDLRKWVKNNIVKFRVDEEKKPLNEVLNVVANRLLIRASKYAKSQINTVWSFSLSYPQLRRNSDYSLKFKQFFNSMISWINGLAAKRSRLYDYTLLAGYSLDQASTYLVRVSKKREGLLGKYNASCIDTYDDMEKIARCIMQNVENFVSNYLENRNVYFSKNVLGGYVRIFMEAYEILIGIIRERVN